MIIWVLIGLFTPGGDLIGSQREAGSDEAPPDVGGSPPHRSASGEPPVEARRAHGVVARAGEEDAGEARVLVVIPPDDAGQRRLEGGGDEGVAVEGGEGAGPGHLSALTADLMEPFVELEVIKKEN